MNQAFREDGEDGRSNTDLRNHRHLRTTIRLLGDGHNSWPDVYICGWKKIEDIWQGGFGST